jgi:hypothetical protein
MARRRAEIVGASVSTSVPVTVTAPAAVTAAVAFTIAAAVTLAGCGSGQAPAPDLGTGPDVCGFAPCGGALVGTWSYADSCYTSTAGGCLGASLPLASDQQITFSSDGTFEVTQGTYNTTIVPASCVSAGLACASGPRLTCTKAADRTCGCVGTGGPLLGGAGTYSVSGSSVVLAVGDARTTVSYCVSGRNLVMRLGQGDPTLGLSH